jgi:hypothetical protein
MWAEFHGADCNWNWAHFMAMCTGMTGGYGRGGTTVGSAFLTGNDPITEPLLSHEEKHTDQYAIFGGFVLFPILYGLEEWRSGGCGANLFEQWGRAGRRRLQPGTGNAKGTCP